MTIPAMEGNQPYTLRRALRFALAVIVGFPIAIIAVVAIVGLCSETTWGGWLVGLTIPGVAIWLFVRYFKTGTPEQKAARRVSWKDAWDTLQWGLLNPNMICPHCQTRGCIRAKRISRKKGISGAKATGALLTGGLSVLATGLSRKERCTQAHCGNCGSTWDF